MGHRWNRRCSDIGDESEGRIAKRVGQGERNGGEGGGRVCGTDGTDVVVVAVVVK